MTYSEMIALLDKPDTAKLMAALYGRSQTVPEQQRARWARLIRRHEEAFGAAGGVRMVSAPGRTEIVGNHTDHNNGKVLAAAISMDMLACVSPRADRQVRMHSDGYEPLTIDLSLTDMVPEEKGTSAALIRGVAARMEALGYRAGGFDAVVTSDVLSGSGLSSSAAFEVLICAAMDLMYNGFTLSAMERAQISQFSENEYFGKPSGLMDQAASSTGGLVAIDFKDEAPVVTPLQYAFQDKGYALVVVNTGGGHDDLIDEYAAIRHEMQAVAACFGQKVLRDVREQDFYDNLRQVRRRAGDRAVLRAMHYFDENNRVTNAVAALKRDDLAAFLGIVRASGRSSWQLLQNLYAAHEHQPLALALAMAEKLLGGEGACRVHGGGFAGTTLNFVPKAAQAKLVAGMEAIFGEGCCHALDVRAEGAAVVL